jgi:hypothetical protein
MSVRLKSCDSVGLVVCGCVQAAMEALSAGNVPTLPEVAAALDYVAVVEGSGGGGRLRFDALARLARGLLAAPLRTLQVETPTHTQPTHTRFDGRISRPTLVLRSLCS